MQQESPLKKWKRSKLLYLFGAVARHITAKVAWAKTKHSDCEPSTLVPPTNVTHNTSQAYQIHSFFLYDTKHKTDYVPLLALERSLIWLQSFPFKRTAGEILQLAWFLPNGSWHRHSSDMEERNRQSFNQSERWNKWTVKPPFYIMYMTFHVYCTCVNVSEN